MAEISDQYMAQQAEMLRDIRDELRGANRASGAASSSGGYGGLRPSPGVLKAQQTADRILSGEWASLGWANGYRPQLQTSLVSDIMMATNLGRAPSTMTQIEAQHLAGQSLSQRAVSTVGMLIAPEFINRSESLGQDIYTNSARFIRAGSSSASVMGAGFSSTSSQRMAREIQVDALSDLRLSGHDYSAIASTGMRAGQFDDVGNTSEFKARLKELASATGDLTRTMRLGVTEVSQVMGNLRSVGIVDISEQRAIGNRMMAVGQVAGMSVGEVANLAGTAGATAQRMGLNWQLGAGLAMDTISTTRAASKVGLISSNIMAMGGGAEGIQGSINQAQMQWLTSEGGYMQMIGGITRGKDAYSSLFSGIAATGGTLSGVMAAQAGKVELLSKMGSQPGVVDAGYAEGLKSQLRLMGITDHTSGQARDAVYSMTRGSMGDAAALAYSRTNFSAEGLRIKDQARFDTFRAEDSIEAKLLHDNVYQATSTRGIVQSAIRNVSGFGARALNWGLDALDPRQAGIAGIGGQYSSDLNAVTLGAIPDSVRAIDLSMAVSGTKMMADPQTVTFSGGSSIATAASAVGGVGGALAGMWLGAKGGAALGTMVAPGLGTVGGAIGGLVLGAIGGSLGMQGGAWAGAAVSPDGKSTIGGTAAQDYIAVAKIVGNAKLGQAAGREAIKNGTFANDAEFQTLARTADRTGMDATKGQQFAASVRSIARNNKVSEETVIGALRGQGMEIGMENAYQLAGNLDEKAFVTDMGDLLSGVNTDVNFAQSSSAAALRDFLVTAETGGDISKAGAAMSDLGVKGASLDKIRANYMSLDETGRAAKKASLGSAVTYGADLAVNRALSTTARVAGSLLDEAESVGQGGVKDARAALEGTAGDRKKLLDLLDRGSSEGGSLRAILGKNILFKEVMDVGKEGDLTSAMASDISKRYRGVVSEQDVTAMRTSGADLKKTIQLRMLANGGEQQAKETNATREAAMLSDAARILQGLCQRLDIKSIPK